MNAEYRRRSRSRVRQPSAAGRSVTLALLALVPLMVAGAGPEATNSPVRVLPVEFEVSNTNRTDLACEADGGTYRVVGELVLPPGPVPSGVTLHLHGSGNGSAWHSATPGIPDHVMRMAEAGHASIVVDQLGYGRSDLPDGLLTCIGSAADVAAQVADAVRSGDYGYSRGRNAPAFAKVALAGHSMGGTIAFVAASSFPNTFDGVVLLGFSHVMTPHLSPFGRQLQVTTVAAVSRASAVRCSDPHSKGPNGPSGYAFGFDDPELPALFYDAPHSTIEWFRQRYELDPCGNFRSTGIVAADGSMRAPRITAPLLVVLGEHDLFPPSAGEALRRSVSSEDAQLEVIREAGHMLMLERQAPAFRAALSSWLTDHGF